MKLKWPCVKTYRELKFIPAYIMQNYQLDALLVIYNLNLTSFIGVERRSQ
jgi:hypothetical protein